MTQLATPTRGASTDARDGAPEIAAEAGPTTSIVTRLTFAVPPEEAWEALMFYEQIDQRPPLHLRLLLPVPIGTEGRKSEVGDEARCLYEGGHLIKRVTDIDRGRRYGFAVVEQALAVGGGMRLSGGVYTLRELGGGRTEVAIGTSYASPKRPRWFWKPIEAVVCHLFHRHLLRAMRRRAMTSRIVAPQEARRD